MKERPILFSAPMVRAILAGRKTQTRRVVKVQPAVIDGVFMHHVAGSKWESGLPYRCPYGKPGDRLWVREAWKTGAKLDQYNATEIAEKANEAGFVAGPRAPLFYPATANSTRWGDCDKEDFGDWGRGRLARFMPRWASRILLEITEVRVQRLQEISQEDAIAEGCEIEGVFPKEQPHPKGGMVGWDDACEWYAYAWEEINGEGSWSVNPWVWTITFKQVQP